MSQSNKWLLPCHLIDKEVNDDLGKKRCRESTPYMISNKPMILYFDHFTFSDFRYWILELFFDVYWRCLFLAPCAGWARRPGTSWTCLACAACTASSWDRTTVSLRPTDSFSSLTAHWFVSYVWQFQRSREKLHITGDVIHKPVELFSLISS